MEIVFLAHNINITFVKGEIHALAQSPLVEKVTVFTDHYCPDEEILTSEKVSIIQYDLQGVRVHKLHALWMFLGELRHNRRYYKSLSQIRKAFSVIRNELRKAAFIYRHGINPEAVIYSFWATDEAFILGMLKKWGLPNLAATRMHGYDVYEELDGHNGIPWRWFILRHLNRFLPISGHGERYFTARYPQVADKTRTFRLGISLPDSDKLNTAPEDITRVVSCGWVNAHKNYLGLFRALDRIPGIHWDHLGTGDEMEQLKVMSAAAEHVHANLPGRLGPEEIQDKYAHIPYTCFISLSTTEGLPVSMMEAMAWGIPIVSTNVGGCSEIVNDRTGVLLPDNYTDEDVARAIDICREKFADPASRALIRQECREKFSADSNYRKFFEFLGQENLKHLRSKR